MIRNSTLVLSHVFRELKYSEVEVGTLRFFWMKSALQIKWIIIIIISIIIKYVTMDKLGV